MSLQDRLSFLSTTVNDAQCEEAKKLHHLLAEKKAGRLIECTSDGYVRLVDHMGDDSSIVQAARVSYGKGTKSVSDDRALIRFMMQHRHGSPFEMVEIKVHIRSSMDTWRQWIRHRTASVNEYSTRYSEAIDSAMTAETWRVQSGKQGSTEGEVQYPGGYLVEEQHMGMPPSEYLSRIEERFQNTARDIYKERLKFGVAREQARKDLPLSTYTEAYWKIDLHNLFHFLELRMDKHAQLEIRTYANAIAQLIKPIVPMAWEAFEDYRLNAITLSAAEQTEIRRALHPDWTVRFRQMSDRERRELEEKLEWLGIPLPQAL